MNIGQITQYFNIGLLVLFLLVVGGLVIAALRGLRRGIWKSTHNMIFMLSLVLIAFVTLNSITDIIGSFPLTFIIKGSFYISREIEGEVVTYYVPITNVKDTLTEFVRGFYTLYNVSASPKSAIDFALALSSSLLKIIIFIVEMVLIVTLGNLLSFITWFLIFQHFIPKVARKVVKIRWVGMLETMVTFLVLTVLFMTPFTSLVNSINCAYQNRQDKSPSGNEMVQNIGNFVDAYNNSLFAKILFNWSYDSKTGTTFDTRLFDKLTTGVSGDYTIGLVGELSNVINIAVSSSNAVFSSGDSEFTFDATNLISQEIIDMVFDAIIDSDLITTIVPVVVDIAMNSDLLDGYIPTRLVDLSDVKWNEEIGYVKEMVDCVFESGAVDAIFTYNEQGKREFRSFEGNGLVHFIEDLIYADDFNRILDIFRAIDDSKVLSRVVPALLYYVISSDTEGNIKKYLPLSWDELNQFAWGFETYILFDFLHSLMILDRDDESHGDFIKAIFIKAGIYHEEEGEHVKPLQTLIAQHADDFKDLLVGKVDDEGNLVNVDSHGQTKVFENGQRIKDGDRERNYCLFDMNLVSTVLPSLLDGLFENDAFNEINENITEEDLAPFHQAVRQLNEGVRLVNYKKEFNAIFDVLTTVMKDEGLLEALFSGNGLTPLMKEEGNFFSIDQEHIDYFRAAISKMDKSSILYSALTPILKSFLLGNEIGDSFADLGLKIDVIVSAIDYDVSSSNHKLFEYFSDLLSNWGDLGTLYSLTTSGNSDNLLDQMKDRDVVDAFVRILKSIKNNKLLNPTHELTGGKYEDNENLYGILSYIFDMTSGMGLEVSDETLHNVEHPGHTWDDEFDAFGNIIYFIAGHDLANASDAFSGGLTRDAIGKVKDSGEGNYDLPGLLETIDDSYIFSETMGPFLDKTLGDSMNGFLIDDGEHITFSNVTNWTTEAGNIRNLLDAMYNLTPEEEGKDILSNFDLKNFDNIVDLNNMLHDLSHSGIFTYIDENDDTHFLFGKWLYGKFEDTMERFIVQNGMVENSYDLLADPIPGEGATWTWNNAWGVRPGESVPNPDPYFLEWDNKYNADNSKTETHYIAYKDFVYINGMADTDNDLPSFWCDYATFKTAQEAFLAAHNDDLTSPTGRYLGDPNNEYGKYYASDLFLDDYNDVFEIDEISKVTRFLAVSMRVMNNKDEAHGGQKVAFNEIPSNLLDRLLTSLNETHCLRASIYNFYRIAAENVFSGYNGFSLSSAYNIYMVDTGEDMFDFTHARPKRTAELDILMTFYDLVNEAKSPEVGVIEGSTFNYTKMNNGEFMPHMKNAVKELNNSYVFHRKGSSKENQLTVFQGLFNTLLGESETKNMIFLGDNSPKDQFNVAEGLYADAASKVRYLVTNAFIIDSEIVAGGANPGTPEFDAKRAEQATEIDNLLDSIQKIYSLKDKEGNTVTAVDKADMNSAENRDTIHALLTSLNNSNLLYDLVPNTIYKMFVDESSTSFSIKSGEVSVDFKRADPFYHYYFDGTIKRASANYEAKYLAADINGIYNLLGDYQSYNEKLELSPSKSLTDKVVLRALIDETGTEDGFQDNGALPELLKHLHDCNIFHSPARNWAKVSAAPYYSDKYNDNGYTLFEELMAKICTFVGLQNNAYDDAYQPDHDNFGSADIKLKEHVKALSKADDNYTEVGDLVKPYYHKEAGTAWYQEISTFMKLAYTATDLGTGDKIDVSNLEINKLKPSQVKTMLTAVNDSDMIADAVPGFVKQGFTTINLGTLTTYNTVNYANYHIGQEGYGGVNGNAPEGSEIDNIMLVMASLNKGTDDAPDYMTNMNDMTTFVKGEGSGEGLTGLFKFIYNSHVFNTSLDGVYDEYNLVDGHYISAQGVLLYNSLGADLSAYVSRDADKLTPIPEAIEKIDALSHIIHMKQYGNDTSAIEAQGIKRLINIADGNINASSFSSGNIQDVKDRKDVILNIIEVSYNATDAANPEDYKRSAIASEFISGVLNNIFENEYTKLDDNTKYPGYRYVLFSFGRDVDDDQLTIADYASLNEVEYNGLDGMIDALDDVNSISISMTAEKRTHLVNSISKMGPTPGVNSKIAQALYLAEAHAKFKLLAGVPNARLEYFVPVDETVTDSAVDGNVYSATFCFKDYSESLNAYLS